MLRSWFLDTILGETADSRAEIEKIQDRSDTSCSHQKIRKCLKTKRLTAYQSNIRAKLKELSMTKAGTI